MKPWAYCKIIDDLFLGYNAENLDNTVKLCFFKFVVMYIAYCFIIQLVLNNFNKSSQVYLFIYFKLLSQKI